MYRIKVQVAYNLSFDADIKTYPIVLPILNNKELFLQFILTNLEDSEIFELNSISVCIIHEKDFELPKWYQHCNGKFFFKNGILINEPHRHIHTPKKHWYAPQNDSLPF